MNHPAFRAPLSPCVRLFLESLLAEGEKETFAACLGFPPHKAQILCPLETTSVRA